MTKSPKLRTYLNEISDIVLPGPSSQVIVNFVSYVVGAHSWYKAVRRSDVDIIAFNFFIGPGPLIEAKGGLNERVYTEFQNLKYGVPGAHIFDVKDRIPREIYDAGLAIVPGNYQSEQSHRIMVATVANMLEAITEYRDRYYSLKSD